MADEVHINVNGGSANINIGGAQQMTPTTARWVLVCGLLFNPWAWLLFGVLWFAFKPLLIGAVVLWALVIIGKQIEAHKTAKQRELDKTALRAEVENEYDANGDPRGLGHYQPPEDLK